VSAFILTVDMLVTYIRTYTCVCGHMLYHCNKVSFKIKRY